MGDRPTNEGNSIAGFDLVHRVARSHLGDLWVALDRRAAGRCKPVLLRLVQLPPDSTSDERHSFGGAARHARSIKHDNVLAVVGCAEAAGSLAVAYEYAEVQPLTALHSSAMLRGVCIAVPVALRVTLDLLRGVSAVHQSATQGSTVPPFGGLSPDSVLISCNGNTQVSDPLIASCATLLWGRDASPTRLSYMAPEQLGAGATLAASADVHACAAMLWEMLAGNHLLSGRRELIESQLLTHDLPDLRAKLPSKQRVSEALIAVVNQSLSLDPGARPQTPEALANELERCGHPIATSEEVAHLMREATGQRLDERRAALHSALEATRSTPKARPSSMVRGQGPKPRLSARARATAAVVIGRCTAVGARAVASAAASLFPERDRGMAAPPAQAVNRSSTSRTGPPRAPTLPGLVLVDPTIEVSPAPEVIELDPAQIAPRAMPDLPLPPLMIEPPAIEAVSLPDASEPLPSSSSGGGVSGWSRAPKSGPRPPAQARSIRAVVWAPLACGVAAACALFLLPPRGDDAESGPPPSAALSEATPRTEMDVATRKVPKVAVALPSSKSSSSTDSEAKPAAPPSPRELPPPALDDAQRVQLFALEQQVQLPTCAERLGDAAALHSGKRLSLSLSQLKAARRALVRGDRQQAHGLLCSATAHFPTNTRAWRELAELSLSLGDAAQAQTAIEQAIGLEPNDLYLTGVLGDVAARLGDLERSRELWRQSVRVQGRALPDDDLIKRFNATADRKLRAFDPAGALTYYRRAVVLSADADADAPSKGMSVALGRLGESRAQAAWLGRSQHALAQHSRDSAH